MKFLPTATAHDAATSTGTLSTSVNLNAGQTVLVIVTCGLGATNANSGGVEGFAVAIQGPGDVSPVQIGGIEKTMLWTQGRMNSVSRQAVFTATTTGSYTIGASYVRGGRASSTGWPSPTWTSTTSANALLNGTGTILIMPFNP